MRLSYSKIKTYLECPYKYRLRYIERIPERPKSYFRFSSLIHHVLHEYHFYQRRKNLDDLLLCYERTWRGQRNVSYQEGRKILIDYYYKLKDKTPYALEERFTVRARENILVGKIDRIDKAGNGFEILDYKLNKDIFTLKEVKDSLQLSLYALAFFHLTGMIPLKVGFYFLRHGKSLFTKKSEQDLEKTENLIDCLARKIMNREFYPKKDRICRWCDYKKYCLSVEKGPTREVRSKKPTQLVFPLYS
jgi:RecB family exonuclease